MKTLVNISRILVGVLFIFSGFIKLNDPLGFSYKLQEYFSPDVLNIPFLEPYALLISVFVVVFEVVLGVFLLIGYKPKFTVWSLLLMIVFFTFLTFYAAYFEKVKDCGCFGDFLKLKPWESFGKDVVLLIFILILFFGVKHIKPIFGKLPTTVLALLGFIFSLWFGYHVLMHLPAIDFRAYAIGKNIKEGMTIPEDAPKPEQEYSWKFNVNGEEKVIVTNGSYPSVDGEFIGVETKVIQEGYTPPVVDFSIESADEDLTEYFLRQDNLIVVVSYSLEKIEVDGALKLKALQKEARRNNYQIIGLTASGEEAKNRINEAYEIDFDWYLCDEKALKTVVRSNPGILELDSGTVMQKVHWNDLEDLELPTMPSKINVELKNELNRIYELDQGVRNIYFSKTDEQRKALALKLDLPVKNSEEGYMKLWDSIDADNLFKVEKIIKKHGYPGKSLVGEPANESVFYVIQHSPKIDEYILLIEKATNAGELPFPLWAKMKDRHLMGQGKPQIYGTQGTVLNQKSNPVNIIWPIENVGAVDSLRLQVGFTSTVEENGKRMFGDDFRFKSYSLQDVKRIEKEHPWIIQILKDIKI
ncbi:DoxX family membrane protein [Hyunsoonleella sp. SJ7]|uniref:DoxX family membrane protein n=1 Tax=Hyunsoonleella aquatilis TaxID=2762758 RepID=A0A923H8N8_9FLAO|nr:BT_3928 family protein [Hyunsoonleella aquatilis]MBC3759256.1 DoxX family membrane protein [Hyunsoonleella aquatilis]